MKSIHLNSYLALLAVNVATAIISSPLAYGGEAENKQLQERILQAMKVRADIDARKQAELYRDKAHDGRLKIGSDTSMSGGVSPNGGSVNLRLKFQ